ncbi:MAG: response regulator [Clostridia bacterium]|nr:response regulator [Clostridia bacterium]
MSNSDVKGGIKYAPSTTSEADMSLLSEKIVENTQAGLMVLSEKGRIVLLNPQAKKMLGLTEEALGNPYMEYLFEDERNDPFNEAILKTVYYKKESLNSILSFFKEDEERQYSVTTCYFSNKEHRHVLISLMDVSALFQLRDTKKTLDKFKKMNAELEAAWQEADLANKAKSTFLSNMSHEIRTPLGAILGTNDIIMREFDDARLKKYTAGINSTGKMLLYLVNDILDVSKLQSGKMEIVPIDYSLQDMMDDLYGMISFRAAEKKLEFSVKLANNCPRRLVGDEIRIKQIITNLMTNAVKYTEKGSVTVNVECIYENVENGALLKVEVRDTGIGIREEDREKIFGRFTRVDLKKNREVEGTGLGLNIVMSLLELMGGSLELDSEYGKGSVFTVLIPQKISDRTTVGKWSTNGAYLNGSSGPLFRAPDARILVVDDNPSNLQIVKSLLEQTEIQTDTATSGRRALEILKGVRYDLVLMDHMMPELDGLETLALLREQDSACCKTVPVIAFTANVFPNTYEYYEEAGFCDYLMKPVEGRKLQEKIMKYLPISKISYTKGMSSSNAQAGGYLSESEAEYYISNYKINANAGIRLLNGSAGLYAKLINIFCEQISDRKGFLREFAVSGDMRKYSIIAHAIKGDAKALGAESLAATSEVHEEESKQGDSEYICRRLDNYLEEINLVQEGLSKLLIRLSESAQDEPDSKTPNGAKRAKVAGRAAHSGSKSQEDTLEAEPVMPQEGENSDLPLYADVTDDAAAGMAEVCRRAFADAQNFIDDFDDNLAIERLESIMNDELSPAQKKVISRALFALKYEFDGDKACEILARAFPDR